MRRHPTNVLAWALVFVAACGSGEFGSLPSTTTSETFTGTGSAVPATTTTDKPEVTGESLPNTTVTATSGNGSDTTTTTEPSTATTSEASGSVQVPQAVLAGVIDDAASRQNVGAAAVTVISGQPVDWPDGSLGCPEPGMVYTQVITPGYLVVIDAGGVTLEYHLNQQGGFKQCTGGTYFPPSDY